MSAPFEYRVRVDTWKRDTGGRFVVSVDFCNETIARVEGDATMDNISAAAVVASESVRRIVIKKLGEIS